ncbi:MAG TPA: pantoate--beta-alanine ligase [candidate division CPR3 bacterium]|uniref:Pantothenate synthetase n=1 Tax=candidate division CPR3 bacterium TaxID=2268181 RepID=A0A7C1NJN0_UNCC3|nr:pantoate--beta-alanine ligase [candidate division CPR3 bacterium]
MKIIKKIREMQRKADRARRKGKIIGLVPTMGYFHEGHLSLMREARKNSDLLVVSIFVNPTQFGPKEDFKSYPRNLKRDLKLAKEIGVDVIFTPDVKEIYPKGFLTYVDVGEIGSILEGASRPGHFGGVTTVVAKLFNIIKPHRAYFGQKDFQQTVVIKKMVKDLGMDVEIVVLPTIREKDGLATSSRNIYLKKDERKAAPVLYKSLKLAEELIKKGERDSKKIIRKMKELLKKEKLIKLEYIAIVDPKTLKEVKKIKRGTNVSLAARIGKARLIDNITVKVS